MVELWEINTEIWCLPIAVDWQTSDYAKVKLGAGIPLLKLQKQCLLEVIQEFGYDEDGDWMVYREELMKFAIRSKHSDPERIVRWEPCRIPIDEVPDETEDEYEFIDQFCRSGWITDKDHMQRVWRALCKHMIHWLVVQNKPLDLKFCRIVSFPFRGNWTEILRQKFPKLKSHECQDKEIQKIVMKEMLSPEMLSYNKRNGRIWRSLNISPLYSFWTNVRKLEQLREDEHRENYWDSVHNRMKGSLTDAIETFIRYLQEIRHPFPFASCGSGEGDSLLPKGWGRIAEPPEKKSEDVHLPDSVDRTTWEVQERVFEDLDATTPVLSEVPDI